MAGNVEGVGVGGRKGPYECGLDAAVDVIGGKWKVLLLWALAQGPRRFGQLRRELPEIGRAHV